MSLTTQSAARKDRNTPLSVTLEHRHFAFIASVLERSRPGRMALARKDGAIRLEEWKITVDHFADACASTNPRFDRARFLAACGVQS